MNEQDNTPTVFTGTIKSIRQYDDGRMLVDVHQLIGVPVNTTGLDGRPRSILSDELMPTDNETTIQVPHDWAIENAIKPGDRVTVFLAKVGEK